MSKDCPLNCIGETATGRFLKPRKTEHIGNVKKHRSSSNNIAKHAWDNDYAINSDSAKVNDKGNVRSRLRLESYGIQPNTEMLLTTLSHFLDNIQSLKKTYNITSSYFTVHMYIRHI